VAAQYSFYFVGVIAGMSGSAKTPGPISGIETPNPRTIVFHLLQPTGDFLSRVAMPAAAPIPPEVAKCFLTAGAYGRYVIASGPYMMQGSDTLDPSSCASMKPISGFEPSSHLTLVRNPAYEPSTDTTSGRLNDPQAIQLTIDSNVSDIFDQISAGSLDTNYYDTPPHTVVQRYATDPSLKGRLVTSQGGLTEYFQMNLTVPPFDDIHVRKAVNYIVDKASIQRPWGGPSLSQIATHVIPPLVLGNVPAANFDLYPTRNDAGDLAKAQAQMKLSKYDTNHDGMCDTAACSDVVMISQNIPPYSDIEPILVADLAKIGIGITPREFDLGTAFNQIQRPKNQIPSQMAVPWVYDYPDAFSYDGRAVVELFDQRPGQSQHVARGPHALDRREAGRPLPQRRRAERGRRHQPLRGPRAGHRARQVLGRPRAHPHEQGRAGGAPAVVRRDQRPGIRRHALRGHTRAGRGADEHRGEQRRHRGFVTR